MKKLSAIFCLLSVVCLGSAAHAVSMQTNGATTVNTDVARAASAGNRGNPGLVNSYQQHQRNTYYMVTAPDIDTACRSRIYECLSEYCGDMTVVPGQRTNKCVNSTESELYNYTLLCLQRDTSALVPTYSTSYQTSAKGMNSAARLCPSYVQQELLSYLSMANLSDQLAKQNSNVCVERRREVEAAMACHSIALSYGNETASKLNTTLTDFCGSGIPGGSAAMVQQFASAGNVGANIWGWAEKVVNLDLSKKGADWQSAMDSVLAGYVNRMNLACGDNMQINTASYNNGNTQPTTLQTAAALAIGVAFPADTSVKNIPAPVVALAYDVYSLTDIYDYATAKQVVNAGLTNVSTTKNAFLTSATMDTMQSQYKSGTKVFILRDSARCYVIPVQSLNTQERSIIAQTYASCVNQ